MLKDKETSRSKNILKALPPIFCVEGAQPFPAGEQLTPSEPPAGRSRLEEHGDVSPVATGDLRLCLKNSQTFEKV